VKKLQIIHVPYDSGHKDYRMGQGPETILRHLKSDRLFDVEKVDVQEPVPLEIGTSFAVARQIAGSIRNAVSSGAFPLVLAGNCISCVGTIAGLGSPSPAMIWLDAHGDFNTPETSDSGFLDGMGLATAVGRCWGRLAATVSGFYPVPEKQVVLVGAREFDPMERTLIGNSDVHLIDSQRMRDQGLQVELEPTLAKTRTLSERAYLHIDLDVLDLGEARINEFSVAGGLRLTELLAVVGLVRKHFVLGAAAISAYDPAYDQDGRGVRAAEAVFRELTKN
jgi:arginase